MDLNPTMRLVMVRAQSEAYNTDSKNTYPEHIFLGILKLPELSVKDVFKAFDEKDGIKADIQSVKEQLEHKAFVPAEARQKLRRALKMSVPGGDADASVSELLAKASRIGTGDHISASNVLRILLNEPTPVIKALFLNQGEGSKNPDKQTAAEKLAKLTNSITEMQYALLNSVRGQDHAVRSFADGIFDAEILADTDSKRVRPKAIFLFAGPPGVGKTFLSEEAAKLLALPFKRFDMSGYSDHQAHANLIGMNPSYKAAKAGALSGFVKDNPNCILLFDEIEKAHLNTIHLFLQILDAGNLHDDFLDENISFKNTIIIFTTNAGRQLYENGKKLKNVARQTILDALETDISPQTGSPFFPSAICSRLASGYPILFNHLQTHDLTAIAKGELDRVSALFQQQYGITISLDQRLASILLFSEGALVDARTLRAQTELFFKNEVYKLCRMWGQDNFANAFSQIKQIHFSIEDNVSDDIQLLLKLPNKPEFLFFSKNMQVNQLREILPGYMIHTASNVDEAMQIAGENELLFIMLDVSVSNDKLSNHTAAFFERIPIASSSLHLTNELLKTIQERLPELAVYLLDSGTPNIDDELEAAFMQKGVRGKIKWPKQDFNVFTDEIERISTQLHLQNIAAAFAAESKILTFETAPKLSSNKQEAVIRLRGFTVRRAIRGNDNNNILDETEKPNTRFIDVIGAGSAKEELKFFVGYLQNPKKFYAQGLKPPKGVLLYGPPGTGKTLLAKAMAGESGAAYIPAVGSGFVNKWQGSGPESIRELFARARRYAPAIIFIDEIDAIGRARGAGQPGHGEEMALNALLAEMDGFSVDPKRPVFVLAATNFDVEEGKGGMGVIDEALARRFDRKIFVDLPDKADRKKYLELKIKKQSNHNVTSEMIERLASRAVGLSLANLESVFEFALRTAIKNNQILNDSILEDAFEITIHGEKKEWSREYLERVARHEAGHAYMCYMAGATPTYLTIVARDDHGGYMEHAETENKPLQTKSELLGRIRTALGGRAAEIVYYGEQEGLSSGAFGDLKNAARIAQIIVCDYGMDDQIGLAASMPKEIWQGALAEKINVRISELLNGLLDEAIQAITEGKKKIEKLVEQLLEKNKLSGEEIESILGKK